MPGPAPPLPPGPPPPQPPYPQQDAQSAAHAAAWAAYYASQGQTGPGYTAPTGQASPAQGAAAASANPYANYGYSAHASAQHSAFIQGQPTGPTYRPNGPQQPQYAAAGVPPHNAQAGYAYQPPQPYAQQFPQQPIAGQAGYNYSQQPQQPYRPPAPAQQAYNAPGQPFYPQNQAYSPVRPSPSPTPGPNRPYQPSARIPSGPARPPMAGPATPPHFPPAKRPRFDGPGNQNPPIGPSGPMNNGIMQNRPPSQPHMHGPVRPATQNMGQPGFSVRPPSLPAGPRGSGIPSGPSNPGTSNNSTPPIIRPPIHLGLNGPPPPLPFGGSMRGRPSRGGLHGGNGQNHGGGGYGRNGPVNAPKGPAGMRRSEPTRQTRENDKKRRDKDREKMKEKDEKITMTDFRIVGIEVKAMGWSWGLTGEAAAALKEESAGAEEEKGESEATVKVEDDSGVNEEPSVPVEATIEQNEDSKGEPKNETKTEETEGETKTNVEAEVKEEKVERGPDEPTSETKAESVDASENHEEKRGEKRKAKTPDGDDEESSPKKRPGEYLLTHRKPNEANESSATASSVHESNQNRFRIYFESPPELDRVPKALRRNPNKRWRRASSSVAPSVQDGWGREGTVGTVAALEDVGEETNSAVEVKDEAVVDNEGETEVNQTTEDAQTDAATESATQTAPPTEFEVVTHEPEILDQPAASSETVDQSLAESASGDANQLQEAQEGKQTGDISTMTESGAAAAISDLVDKSDVSAQPVISTSSDRDDGVVAAVETPKTETPKIKLQGIHSLPPKPVSSANPASLPVPPKPAAAETGPDGATTPTDATATVKSRTRRRSSVSSQGSVNGTVPDLDIPNPSVNRVSILYEGSQRRLCIDAAVVEAVKIHRGEGKIEMVLSSLDKGPEGNDLPKGVLAEMYDTVDQRFACATVEKLEESWSENESTLPPLHRPPPEEPVVLTVYLNKKRPLSEPKWCRNDSADEWLIEQFGSRKAGSESGWKGKLHIVDPDPAPTLQSILDSWASSSSVGLSSDRKTFTQTLQSDPNDLLEILLRLTRGERNPTASTSGTSSLGPLATAIRADSPFASHQTHVSLAILAMYRLTTDYAAKAGEKSEVVNEKISDIIKSLPSGMIHRSLDGLFKEWKGK